MADKTINDLHILLTEQNGDIKAMRATVESLVKQFDTHTANDNTVHANLHARISGMKKYGSAISIVSVFIGWLLGSK